MKFSTTSAAAAAAYLLAPAYALSSANAISYSSNTVSTAPTSSSATIATSAFQYYNTTAQVVPTTLSTAGTPLVGASNGQNPKGPIVGSDGVTTVFITVPGTCAATGVPSLGGPSYGNAGSGSGSGSGSASANGKGSSSGSASGSASPATSAGYVAPAQLIPAVHWDHPVDNLDNLKPVDDHQLYYTDKGVADPDVEHLFASLSTTLQHLAVILDHSSYVKSVSCSADGILVSFTTDEAFKYASDAWSGVPEFVLVTYANGCGKTQDQRSFWLISGITAQSDTNSILAKVTREIPVEQALDAVDLAWGTYYPPGSKVNGTAFGGTTGGSTTGSSTSNSTGSGSNASGSSGSSSGSGSGSGSSTGTGTGNSSGNSSSSANADCGPAPSSQIDGFPAAACGAQDFDKQLDDALGYFDMSNPSDYASDVKDFVPDVDFEGDDLVDDDADGDLSTRSTRRALRKRGLWGWIKKAVSTVVKVAVKVATAPLQIAAAAVRQIPVVGNFIAKATEFDPSVSGTTDIKLGPSNSATSPWGEAAMLYQKASSSGKVQADVTLYCVDCGIKGHVTIAGVAKWNLLDGLKALNANMKANMEAGLNLGLVATAVFSDEKKKSIINQAIPNLGMSVKGIFSAGVFVGVDAVAKINIKAEGQALVGVTMAWPAFEATLDLIGDGSKVTGYEPQFKKRFEASGTISADARLSLPVSFNVGIEIIPLSWKKAISLIEEPSLFGNVTFAGSTPGAPPASETCNNGFEYFANAQNDIKFDLFGIKTIPLSHYDSPPLLKGCKLLESPAPSTGTPTGSDSTGSGTGSTGTDQTGSTGSGSTGTDQTGSTGSGSTGTDNTGTETPGSDNQGSSGASDPSTGSTDSSDGSSTGATNGQTTGTDNTQSTGGSSDPTDNSSGAGSSDKVTASEGDNPSKRAFAAIVRRAVVSQTTSDIASATTSSSTTDTVIANDGEDDFGSNPSDASADLDPSDPRNNDDTAEAQTAASDATTNGGFTYTTIVEAHNAFALIPGDDGNLYAGDAGTGGANGTGLWGVYDGVAAIDDGKRVLHYYPDVMAKYGVSRIRLSSEDHIPKPADFVVLQRIDADGQTDTPNPLFAVTTTGDAFALVLCDFAGDLDSKLFIVNGDDGVQKLLQDKDLRYTVTGGVVQQCDPVALVFGKN